MVRGGRGLSVICGVRVTVRAVPPQAELQDTNAHAADGRAPRRSLSTRTPVRP